MHPLKTVPKQKKKKKKNQWSNAVKNNDQTDLSQFYSKVQERHYRAK